MKKRIIAIVAIILAVLIALAVIFVSCDGDDKGGKKKQQVVIITKDDDDDGDEPVEEEPDEEPDENDDPYAPDDITLDDGYNIDIVYSPSEIMESNSDFYQLSVNNNEENIASPFFRGTTGSVYWCTEYMDKNAFGQAYTEEMLDYEFSRYADIGLTVLRTGFWSDWMYTGDPNNPWDNDNENLNNFYDFCRAAAKYNLEVVPMMAWSYPNFLYGGGQYLTEVGYMYPRLLDENGKTTVVQRWGQYFEEPDVEEMNKRFASWVVATVQGFKDHGITNVNYILFGNEPHEDGGSATGAFVDYQIGTFSAAHEALKAAGLRDRVKLIGPNQSCTTPRAGLAVAFMDRAPEVFDILSSHNSPKGTDSVEDNYERVWTNYSGWMEKMDDHNLRFEKEFWCDEYSGNADTYGPHGFIDPWVGVQQCAGLVAATNAGISGINFWQIFDQLWPNYYGSGGEYQYGVQMDGACKSLYEGQTPYPSFYALTLFTKYMSTNKNPGTSYRCDTDEASGLYVTAAQHPNGDFSVMVVNTSLEDRAYELNFANSLGGKTLYRYLYNPATIVPNLDYNYLPADKAFTNVGDTLADKVAGGNVVVYSTIKNLAE